jgi:endonuclease III-like uncharacterized protein
MIRIGGGCWYNRVGSEYADVLQRLLLIFSEKTYETFRKNLEKELKNKKRELKHLRNMAYDCAEHAEKAAQTFSRKREAP